MKKLLLDMNNIKEQYYKMNMYPYELYTLMYSYAVNNNLEYNMEIHSNLLENSI